MGVTTESIYENSPSVVGITWIDMQNYRDPPPYPGHSKQVFPTQPGFRQSFSGSEASTDVSLSSTENLATSQRQEPQGEENQSPFYHHQHPQHHPHQYYYNHQHLDSADGTSSYSILARLGMPPGGLEPSTTGGKGGGGGGGFGYNPSPQQQQQQQQQYQPPQGQSSYHPHHHQYHHHPTTNSSVPSSTYAGENIGNSGGIGGGSTGNINNSGSGGSSSHYHQHQYHSLGGNVTMGSGSGGGGHGYNVIASDGNYGIDNSACVGDPLYSHGNQLTVPQWKIGESGSRKNSGAGLYSQQQSHQQYNESSTVPTSSSSAGAFIKTRMESASSSSSAFSSSILSSSSSSSSILTSSSSLLSTSKTINQYSRGNTNTAGTMLLSSTTPSTIPSSSSSSSSIPHPPPPSSSLSSTSTSSSSSSSSSNETVSSLGYNSHPRPHRMADYAGGKNNPHPSSSHPYLSPRVPPVSTYHHPHPYVNAPYDEDAYPGSHHTITTTVNTSTASPSTTPYLPPPPNYPGLSQRLLTTTATTPRPLKDKTSSSSSSPSSLLSAGDNIRPCRSYETIVDKMDKLLDANLTHQPDIHRLCASSPGIYVPHHSRSPVRSANASSDDGSDQASSSVVVKASRMMDVLTEENRALREELATATIKVNRLSKFEVEVHKMHDAHESLLESHQKRETLWLAMRRKLEERIRGLEEFPPHAGGGGTRGDPSKSSSVTESDLRARLMEKESLIARLIAQNQELLSNRNQLETENIQLNMTLAEQRARVDIVEKALVNCQAKVLMGDEEIQKKISGEVAALGCSSFHSGTMESHANQEVDATGKMDKDMSPCLKQTYMKDATSGLRIDETSQPLKEVRLAALEKNSSDVEKLIDEAKTEKLKHMEELHESNKKMAELEAKVKQLQSQLVEKEAMVKVFQRSPYSLLPRSSSLHALCHHSPMHSPRPSLIASQALEGTTGTTASAGTTSSSSSSSTGGAGSHREFSSIRHMKTGSTSAIDMGRKLSIEEDLLTKVQGLANTETRDDSMEEVKLWHV